MKNMKVPGSCMLILASLFILGACNTVPTSSSSSSSSSAGGPPPSGSGSSSSSGSSGGGQSSQGSSTSQGAGASGQSGAQSASGGSQAGSQATAQGGSQGGNGEDPQQASTANAGTGTKSDDEILADALGEFDRGLQGARQGSGEQAGSEAGARAGNTGTGTSTGQQGQAGQPGVAAGTGQSAMTEEEKARILEARLDDKFARFDDLMLGEREKINKSDNESGSGGGYGGEGGGDGEGYDEGPLQTAMADQQPPPSGRGFPGDKHQGEDLVPPPADVGDGQDDDIIARQLREAAQKEKDPELRAKLWDEYRKYKKGA